MPTPGEIQKKAKRINSVNDDFCRGKDRCQGYVYNSSSWWEGEAGKVLRSEYTDIQIDITKLLTKMSKLESCINKLADKVRQADDERRSKKEEQRRLALAAKNNSKLK